MKSTALALALALAGAGSVTAQQTRNELFDTAAGFITPDSAKGLLYVALNPDSGFGDAPWTGGVMLLAELLNGEGETEAAATWLRWAVRLTPEMTPDTVLWTPETNQAFRDALTDVAADTVAGDTRWVWPVDQNATGGTLTIGPPNPAGATVLVLGFGGAPGQSLALGIGSHQLQGSAPGYVQTTVTREVLPGVTTIVDLTLPVFVAPEPEVVVEPDSVLPAGVRDAVLARSGRVTIRRLGQPVCAAGLLLPDGLLLTTYEAIRGAESATVASGGAVESAGQVAAYDVEENLAVLAAGPAGGAGSAGDSLVFVQSLDSGQNVWGVGLVNCASTVASRTTAGAWDGSADPPVLLEGPFMNAGTGSPVFDRAGALVGLTAADGSVIPAARAIDLIADAIQAMTDDEMQAVTSIAQRERHMYGTARITSDSANSTVRVVPLENWHWVELAGEHALPATFEGPIGRYALELMRNGAVIDRTEVELPPRLPQQYALNPQIRGGGFPIGIVVGILAAGGGAACLLAICKTTGSEPPGGNGAIEVKFPIRE